MWQWRLCCCCRQKQQKYNEWTCVNMVTMLQWSLNFAKHTVSLDMTITLDMFCEYCVLIFSLFFSFCLSFPLPAGRTITWPLLFHQQVSAQFPVLWNKFVIWLGSTPLNTSICPQLDQSMFAWQLLRHQWCCWCYIRCSQLKIEIFFNTFCFFSVQ